VKANPEKIVVIAQIRTVSCGINELVAASHIVFMSLSQQREEFAQARDRLHRIGQEKPVTSYILVAKGTIDEQILRHYHERINLEAAILDHVRQTGRTASSKGLELEVEEDGYEG
jgi:SNF2 family DNA or RNA helicase